MNNDQKNYINSHATNLNNALLTDILTKINNKITVPGSTINTNAQSECNTGCRSKCNKSNMSTMSTTENINDSKTLKSKFREKNMAVFGQVTNEFSSRSMTEVIAERRKELGIHEKNDFKGHLESSSNENDDKNPIFHSTFQHDNIMESESDSTNFSGTSKTSHKDATITEKNQVLVK